MQNRRNFLSILASIPFLGFLEPKQAKAVDDVVPTLLDRGYNVPLSVLKPENWRIIGNQTSVHPDSIYVDGCKKKVVLQYYATKTIERLSRLAFSNYELHGDNILFYKDIDSVTLMNGDTLEVELDTPDKWIS